MEHHNLSVPIWPLVVEVLDHAIQTKVHFRNVYVHVDPHINTVTAINVQYVGVPEVEILLVGIAITGTIIPFIGIPYTMVPFGFATAEIHLSSAYTVLCCNNDDFRYATEICIKICCFDS